MNVELTALINELNSSRAKIYYKLKQLEEITGLSARSLKYRMLKVKEKYRNSSNLLSFEGRSWKIHYTLLSEFLPVYNKKNATLYGKKWQTFITWNTRESYDVQYHDYLIKEIKEYFPTSNIAYVVEKDSRGVNHIHALSEEGCEKVQKVVEAVLEKYIGAKYYKAQIEKINNRGNVAGYISKSGIIKIV